MEVFISYLFFGSNIYHLLLLTLNFIFFYIFFFPLQIASMFGPAFLLKLYVAGALTGSAFFLLEKAFLSPQKRVRTHSCCIYKLTSPGEVVQLDSSIHSDTFKRLGTNFRRYLLATWKEKWL
jgi:hypothetical protein